MATRVLPPALSRRLLGIDALVPCCHLVSARPLPHVRHYTYKSPAQFESDVIFAHERLGFVDHGALADLRRNGSRPPGGSFLFTFDDGFAECWSVIRPILKRHSAPAVFFVTTSLIDNASMFFESKIALCLSAAEEVSAERLAGLVRELGVDADLDDPAREPKTRRGTRWLDLSGTESSAGAQRELLRWAFSLDSEDDERIERFCDALGVSWRSYLREESPYLTSGQIRDLASDGFVIGAHAVTHHPLQGLDRDALESVVQESCARVREITGQARVPFAFPYSGAGIERRWLEEIASRVPLVDLFYDTQGLRPDHPLVVNRFWQDAAETLDLAGASLPQALRRELGIAARRS